MNLCKIWIEQCEAARGIEDEFGTQKALAYLVEEKFLNYLEAVEKDPTFQAEVPAFAGEIWLLSALRMGKADGLTTAHAETAEPQKENRLLRGQRPLREPSRTVFAFARSRTMFRSIASGVSCDG